MAVRPSLMLSQSPGEAPARIALAPGQDIDLSTVTAAWDGTGASGSFLACLAMYAQDGTLLSRTHPSQVFAAGDAGVVTYGPFLGDEAAGSDGDGAEQYPNVIHLPVLTTLANNSQLEAFPGGDWIFDTAYLGNFYLKLGDADGDHVSWLVKLGPKGSRWNVQCVAAFGPAHGRVKFEIGSVPAGSSEGELADVSAVNFVPYPIRDPATFLDFYSAVFQPFVVNASGAEIFKITGEDGAIGTSFTTVLDYQAWDGGAGMHRIKLSIDGKNAASTGFKLRLAALALVRVDEFNQP